jgi:predicted Zn-dependent protease
VSQGLLVQNGLTATQVALSRNDPATVQAVTSLLGAGATVGVVLPWSRSQESEADHLGLIYMAKAGYDPTAARDLWVRMQQATGSRQPEYLSSHPAPVTSIAQIASRGSPRP